MLSVYNLKLMNKLCIMLIYAQICKTVKNVTI